MRQMRQWRGLCSCSSRIADSNRRTGCHPRRRTRWVVSVCTSTSDRAAPTAQTTVSQTSVPAGLACWGTATGARPSHLIELLAGVTQGLDHVIDRGAAAIVGGRACQHQRDVDQVPLQRLQALELPVADDRRHRLGTPTQDGRVTVLRIASATSLETPRRLASVIGSGSASATVISKLDGSDHCGERQPESWQRRFLGVSWEVRNAYRSTA